MRGALISSIYLLAGIGGVFASYNANSKTNLALYWGQNSAGQATSQQRLSYYCDNADTDVILLSFLLQFNGQGGQPVMNFANQGDKCSVFSGTQTFYCPEIEADIPTCQAKGKTIILSIGGATYTEGGFSSASAAQSAASKVWAMFGPKQSGSSALRPFGNAVVDGFDFDLEANTSNMDAFGIALRNLENGNTSKKFYLTAAPQCFWFDPYAAPVLNAVSLDFIMIQFYNNWCGVSNYRTSGTQDAYNINQWDDWARNTAPNKNTKILMGVPASSGAGGGYVSASGLDPIIKYNNQFKSFAGVMIWDASQAYTNNAGFIAAVKNSLRSLSARAVAVAFKG